MKDKKQNTTLSEKVLKSNRKIIKRVKIDAPNIQIHDCSLSWLGTSTSIKVTGVPEKLYFAQ